MQCVSIMMDLYYGKFPPLCVIKLKLAIKMNINRDSIDIKIVI